VTPTATPPQLALSRWLRLLWDTAPGLQLDSEAPFISGGRIHLPPQARWQHHCAAAAHAVAHLVYSPDRFPAEGLVPTSRALLALLEDARVEALAMRELPGLARLWRPLHSASVADGHGAAALMGRLARALADPTYHDPHPWVVQGRRVFFLDEALALPALRTPADVRAAALQLGHALGQMRLPFNPRSPGPGPAYRDDHRWMWDADRLQPEQPPPSPKPAPTPSPPAAHCAREEPPADRVSRHPEWDHLIQRLRPQWVQVHEQAPAPAGPAEPTEPESAHHAVTAGGLSRLGPAHVTPITPAARANQAHLAAGQALEQRLLAPLQPLLRRQGPRGRAHHGERFHLDALLAWQIQRRCGHSGDDRVFRDRQTTAQRPSVWLLVDQSASTAAILGPEQPGAPTVLHTALAAAHALAGALQRLGLPCGVAAFHSDGRHAVRFQWVQPPGRLGPAERLVQLQRLRPLGSTRLGAALRHASQANRGPKGTERWVWLLSDAEPHDVDVHDPRYLVEDAHHAVRSARRQGVKLACISLGAQVGRSARRIFGRQALVALPALDALPRALRQLLR